MRVSQALPLEKVSSNTSNESRKQFDTHDVLKQQHQQQQQQIPSAQSNFSTKMERRQDSGEMDDNDDMCSIVTEYRNGREDTIIASSSNNHNSNSSGIIELLPLQDESPHPSTVVVKKQALEENQQQLKQQQVIDNKEEYSDEASVASKSSNASKPSISSKSSSWGCSKSKKKMMMIKKVQELKRVISSTSSSSSLSKKAIIIEPKEKSPLKTPPRKMEVDDTLPTLIAIDTPSRTTTTPSKAPPTPSTSDNNNNNNKASLPPMTPTKSPTKQKKQKQKKAAFQKEATPVAKDTTKTATIGKTSKTSTSSSPTNNNNDHSWTGRIVGLRLPPNVDSNFDEKSKPIDRRIDPFAFLAKSNSNSNPNSNDKEGSPKSKKMCVVDNNNFIITTTATSGTAAAAAAAYDTNHMPFHAQSTEVMSISLDIYLSDENNDTSTSGNNNNNNKPIKLHMTRDPNEDVTKTLHRLQLSVQKKVGGKKKKQKKKKGKNCGNEDLGGGKQNDETVLWRKKKPKVEIRPAVVVEPAFVIEESSLENIEGNTFWEGFYDALTPSINVFQCGDKSNHHHQEQELVWNDHDDLELHESVSSFVNDSVLMEGYEQLTYTDDSLSINEVLHRAANMATDGDDLGRYALSVPIVTSNNNSSATSWIPLELESCPPTITSVSTFGSFKESHLFVRTPVVVEVALLFATECRILWFADGELVSSCDADDDNNSGGGCYTPTFADVGKVLTVVIVPTRHDHDGNGCEEAYQFQRQVEALPALPNVTPLREEFLNRPQQQLDSGDGDMSLRVVTYNILADQNASRDVDKDDDAERMYSHCKNEHIAKWRRHPLIIHEILEYSPDVIALQEVDTDVFEGLLKPVLNAKGYEGYFSQKGVDPSSGVREGCAIFWSLDIFESVRPVDMRTHTFRDMIQQFSCEERMHKRQWKSLNDMADLLDKHTHLKHVLFHKLGHVMQTVVLTQRNSQEKVVIGNSHLFYHPMASHIRCLKILMACRQLEIEHKENQNCPMIFCGDFNSHPNSGVMKLLLNRYLDSNNGKTWKHLHTYSWDEGDDGMEELLHDVEAIDLELPSSFPRFASAYPVAPEFTHFIEAFVCTLDYILVSKNFELEKSGATPSRADIEKYVAMPNECMPSDHVSLVCDLKWR